MILGASFFAKRCHSIKTGKPGAEATKDYRYLNWISKSYKQLNREK